MWRRRSNGKMEQWKSKVDSGALEAHGRHESNSKQAIDDESWRAAGKAEIKVQRLCV